MNNVKIAYTAVGRKIQKEREGKEESKAAAWSQV